jgi:TRAP-type C4-dicarboxylate transport system substrate-binding protein
MQLNHLARKLLVIGLVTLLLPHAASAAQTLTFSDHEPLGGMRTRFIKDVLFAAIEKESNGRLKIEDHWDSKISTGYDALQAVGKDGKADLAIVVPEYRAKDLPLHQIFKSFPVGPTGDKQLAFFRRVYAEVPAFPAELAKANVVNLFFATGYPVAYFGTAPLNSLADIKGSKWRSASFWHQDQLRNAGAIPVTMPWGEGVYKALQARTLDGLMVNVDSGYMLKVHETAPHVLVSKDLWLGHVYLLAMNKDKWDRLAKEDQEAIGRAATTAYKTLGAVMDSSFDNQLDDLRNSGAKVRILERSEVASWASATRYQDVQAAWVKQQQDIGNKDVSHAMEKVKAIMNDLMR